MSSVAIIVPVYNVEKYLLKCLNSIFVQTYKKIHIICINDGSTDGSLEILNKNKDKISIINQKNKGLSATRNLGINYAIKNFNPDYLYFLDSDDYIEKNTIELLVESIRTNSSDMALGRFILEDENGVETHSFTTSKNYFKKNYKPEEALQFLYGNTFSDFFQISCNKLYKTSLFMNIRFSENRLYEDAFIAHRIITKCTKISFVNVVTYHYVKRNGSIMSQKFNSKSSMDYIDYHVERMLFFRNKYPNIAKEFEPDLYRACVTILSNLKKFFLIKIKIVKKTLPLLNSTKKKIKVIIHLLKNIF